MCHKHNSTQRYRVLQLETSRTHLESKFVMPPVSSNLSSAQRGGPGDPGIRAIFCQQQRNF